ncbi:MAG: AMP-binding protein [Ketobacteraceae bacterium]|nr:AMP-binding protein [Ketobacteraceae bacterium]
MRYLRWADADASDNRSAVAGNNYTLAPVTVNCAIYNDQLKVELQCQQPLPGAEWINDLTAIYQQNLTGWLQLANNAPIMGTQEPASNKTSCHNLTATQKGMLMEIQRHESRALYITQSSFTLKGIDVSRAMNAWHAVVAQHEAFCYTLSSADPDSAQWQLDSTASDRISRQVISARELAEGKHALQAALKDEKDKIETYNPPLIKAAVFKQRENVTLAITGHHLITDGWSQSILWQEWFQAYASGNPHAAFQQREVDRYSDYFNFVASKDDQSAREFWRSQLSHIDAPTRLTHLYTSRDKAAESTCDKNTFDTNIQTLSFTLNQHTVNQLTRISKKQAISTNCLLQALWQRTLSFFDDNPDPVFGTVFSGRDSSLPGLESRVGLYINVVPVPVVSQAKADFLHSARCLQDFFIEAAEHQWLGLQEILNCTASPMGGQLFDTLLAFENYPVNLDKHHLGELGIELVDTSHQDSTHYPLVVSISQSDTLLLEFSYLTELFSEYTVNLLAQYYTRCIENIEQLLNSDRDPYLSKWELHTNAKQDMVNSEDVADTETTAGRNLVEIFLDQCRQHPQQTAIETPQESITYHTLYERASAIANALAKNGAVKGIAIGICHASKAEGIVAMVACALSGCPYVPLDPGLGLDRIRWMITESNIVQVLVDDLSHSSALATLAVNIIDQSIIKPDKQQAVSASHQYSPAKPAAPSPLYILFTSGTTGEPKGVEINSDAMVNLCCIANPVPMNKSSRVSQTSTHLFDFSQYEIWGPLLNSGTCVPVPKEITYDPPGLADFIAKNHINIVTMPTGILQLMANDLPHSFDNAEYVLFGGEACPAEVIRNLRNTSLCPHLVNLYGPTECTVFCTFFEIPKNLPGVSVPIGKPIPGVQAFVINKSGKILTEGMPGELCIAGDCLGSQYLNQNTGSLRSEITDHHGQSITVYRTGDRVVQLQGQLHFLGRKDNQLKVRGFRIDPTEIQNQLRQCHGIKDAAVTGENNRLIAFLEADDDVAIDNARTTLGRTLPYYMIPNLWIRLNSLPRNSSGKIDYKRLAIPDRASTNAINNLPNTATETKIAEIWCQLLRISRVSREDNFFDLGGHSLLVAKLANQIRDSFNVNVPVRAIFELGTCEHIAALIDSMENASKDIDEELGTIS